MRTILIGLTVLLVASTATAGDDFTMTDYRETVLRFTQETFVDVFKERTDPEAPWRRDAVRCIEETAKHFAGLPDRPLKNKIFQPGRRALKAGCEDPFLLYALGFAENKIAYVERAVEGMNENGDAVHRRAFATLRLARMLRDKDEDRRARALFEQGADLLVEMVSAGAYGEGRERLLFAALEPPVDNELPVDLAERVCTRLEKLDDVDPWVAKTVRGVFEIRRAWDERGNRFAHEVRDEQWDGFYRHLNRAYRVLGEAHALRPDRPEAATYLITVAMGGSSLPREDERYWFDQAVAAQVDWPRAYSKIFTALLPKWGGGLSEMYEFGLECKRTERYDTLVPFQLAEALVRIADDADDRGILTTEGVYEEVREMIERYAKAWRGRKMPGYQMNDRYWPTLLAGFAWSAGRFEDARAALDGINNKIMAAPFDFLTIDQKRFYEDVYTYTSDIGPTLRAADQALVRADVDEAVKLYRDALAELPEPTEADRKRWSKMYAYKKGDIDVGRWVRDRLAALDLYRQLKGGGWVDLLFDEDLSGWTVEAGRWEYIDERTVSGSSSKDGLILLHDLPLGPHWELRGTYRFPETTEKQRKHSAAVYFHARYGFEKADWQGVGFHPKLDQTLVQRRWYTRQRIELDTPVEPVGQFHVQVWEDELVAILDGEVVFAGATPGRGYTWQPGPYFGIGGLFWYSFRDLRFEGLQIRMLPERPEILPEREEEPELRWIFDREDMVG
ncbi:MAG: hypothetical protein ACYTGP_01285 [Planctomycetota bacterium]|jgi:hypothetical protein